MKTTIQHKLLILASIVCLGITTGFSQAQSAQNISCLSADINKDAVVNQSDFNLFLPYYGTTCAVGQPCPSDINKDGITSQSDFIILLGSFGQRCEAMIFDVSHAEYITGYVNVPVSISSKTTNVQALDFATTINENKLTYSSIIYSINQQGLAYFNPNDRTLRFTSTISDLNAVFPNDTKLFSIRFAINAGVTISPSDLNVSLTLLNGKQVGAIVK